MSVGDDDHPLFFELKNIRAALARCQEESHGSAVKLQRHSLDNAQNHERAAYLQQENDFLKAELAFLRATPIESEPLSESKAKIQELTVSLRELSHKLTMTEEALQDKNKALLIAQADVTKARAARDAANDRIAEFQAREETEGAKVKDLALRIRKQEEELRMSDVVIEEYAELVRQMEARPKTDQANAEAIRTKSSTLHSALSHGRFDLQSVIEDFRSQYDEADQELGRIRGELEIARSQLIAEQQAEHAIMDDFTLTRTELDQLKINDGTAAKMVARYMQFSQSSTNSLLSSLETLKTRHAATLSTLSGQNQLLLTRIRSLELQNEQLRNNLDDLGGEVLKEKYGRRREIGLRIRMGGREQRIAEGLRRWVRRSEEAVRNLDCQDTGPQGESALLASSQDARILLDSLEHGGADEQTAVSLSGTRARALMVRGGVDELLEELRVETERRVMLQVSGNNIPMDVVGQEGLEPEGPEHSPHGKRNSRDISVSSLSTESQIRGDTKGDETMVVATPSSPDVDVQLALPRVEEVLPECVEQHSPSPGLAVEDTDTTPDQLSTRNHEQLEADGGALLQHHPTDENLIVEPPSHSAATTISSPVPTVNRSLDDSLPANATQLGEGLHVASLTQLSQDSVSHSAITTNSTSMRHDKIVSDCQQTSPMGILNPDSLSSLTSDAPHLYMAGESEELLPHPLLARLTEVNRRYDVFQCDFRDCHLALEGLKASLASTSGLHASSTDANTLPLELLRSAVARLDDFTEDVRVELEIKIGDEALLVKGYEALLQVPGALSSYSQNIQTSSRASGGDGESPGTPSDTDIEKQINAFLDGSDPTVKRVGQMFKAKLEDVQHDIATLKRAIHDPDFITGERFLPAPPSSSSISVAPVRKTEEGFDSTAHPAAGGWSSWIRGTPSRPTTPSSGFGPSPTFGNVVTSPRFRQSSQTADQSHLSQKFTEGEKSKGLRIIGSLVGLAVKDAQPPSDPLRVLGLRIAMPSFNADGYGIVRNGMSPTPMSAPFVSPSFPSSLGVGPPPTPRPRTSSAMYMLGLGSFGGSGSVSRTTSIKDTNANGTMDGGVNTETDTEDAVRTRDDYDIE